MTFQLTNTAYTQDVMGRPNLINTGGGAEAGVIPAAAPSSAAGDGGRLSDQGSDPPRSPAGP
jgi:hypothetical protein